MPLTQYLDTLQGFVRDRSSKIFNQDDLISYINRARREIALRSQCIRSLTPISGSIISAEVLAGGSGYPDFADLVISVPDSPSGALPAPAGRQAVGQARAVAGVVVGIAITDGGSGYFQPTIEIDPLAGGEGATIQGVTNPINVTEFQQEIYSFSNAVVRDAGVDSVFAIKSVSLIYANYRYSAACYDFSTYQALIRQYPRQYIYVPTVFGQYGQGTAGSLYMYPLPSQAYQMEWDCFCLPSDLQNDQDAEAIPMPWSDAIPLGAAVYAFEEKQEFNNAKYWQTKYDDYCHRYSAYARPGMVNNRYGRY